MDNTYTNLQKKILERNLNSEEVREEFNQTVKRIKSQINENNNEATLVSIFEKNLYKIFSEINLDFNPIKEDLIETKRHSAFGRIDSRIGAVIIEYKKPKKLSTQSEISNAINQTSRYLESISSEGKSAFGFITNGNKYIELGASDGSITRTSSIRNIDSNALITLARNIFSLQLDSLSINNFIRDFCGSNFDGSIFCLARTLLTALTSNRSQKTNMLFHEWEELFRLGHNDRSQQRKIQERRKTLENIFKIKIDNPDMEYLSLFSLHTAYAVVIKLIAYKVISELYFEKNISDFENLINSDSESLRSILSRIEDGDVFKQIGIINLLEGDFFSWYTDTEQWDDSIKLEIINILGILSRYENASGFFNSQDTVDLFKLLYEETIPQSIRSSFGEFYTPFWLAENLLYSSLKKVKGDRILDPCSGSGTFINAAIDYYLYKKEFDDQSDKLECILNNIVGIDLNPLAVLTSRVNYFIRISNLLDRNKEYIIPIFLGDASNVPLIESIDGVKCVSYELKTIKDPINVSLPISLVIKTKEFIELMSEFESYISNLDKESAINLILESIPPEDKKLEIISKIECFTSQLISLEKKQWNGIWARILTNFLSTATLKPFDLIIGNPPWIDWRNLPSSYRERIKTLCIDRGLFSGDGRTGGINLNICALISYVTISNWLQKNGILAFLMPKELSYQQSYQGWRNLGNDDKWSIIEFNDWSFVGHPFDPVKEDFMTYKISSGHQKKFIPVLTYYRKEKNNNKPKDWKNWEEASGKLSQSKNFAGQITSNSSAFTFAENKDKLKLFELITGECSYIGREGVEFYPQELLLFNYLGEGPTKDKIFVNNYQNPKSKFRIPQKRILLEKKYIFPLVKGIEISSFEHHYGNLLVAFPYDSSDYQKPIPREKLQSTSPLLLKYYVDFQKIIQQQTGFSDKIRGENPGEFYGLARVGNYTFHNVHVCYRDNSKWVSSVISNHQLPWGEKKTFLFQNHAVSICERADGTFIDNEESHYICSILNTEIVKDYIYSTSDERSFKIRLPIFLPLYDSRDPWHKKLSQNSQLLHSNKKCMDIVLKENEEIYLNICKQKN